MILSIGGGITASKRLSRVQSISSFQLQYTQCYQLIQPLPFHSLSYCTYSVELMAEDTMSNSSRKYSSSIQKLI